MSASDAISSSHFRNVYILLRNEHAILRALFQTQKKATHQNQLEGHVQGSVLQIVAVVFDLHNTIA
jgi:hypothetical protein